MQILNISNNLQKSRIRNGIRLLIFSFRSFEKTKIKANSIIMNGRNNTKVLTCTTI